MIHLADNTAVNMHSVATKDKNAHSILRPVITTKPIFYLFWLKGIEKRVSNYFEVAESTAKITSINCVKKSVVSLFSWDTVNNLLVPITYTWHNIQDV